MYMAQIHNICPQGQDKDILVWIRNQNPSQETPGSSTTPIKSSRASMFLTDSNSIYMAQLHNICCFGHYEVILIMIRNQNPVRKLQDPLQLQSKLQAVNVVDTFKFNVHGLIS